MAYALGLLLLLLPSYQIRFEIFGFPTTALEILIGIFLVASLATSDKTGWAKIRKLKNINLAASLFILAGIISTIISPDKTHALGILKAFIIEPILIFYAILLSIKEERQIKIVLKFLLIGASLVSLFGIIQYFTLLHLPFRFWGTGSEVERITSVFDYPNALALYLAPLFGLFGTLWSKKFTLFSRGFDVFCLLLVLAGIILTFSRGAWFAVLLAFIWFFAQKFDWKKVLSGVVALGIILLLIPPIFQRIKIGVSDPSSVAHLDLMKVGLNKVLSEPFLGNGLSGFRTTLEQAHFQGEILNYPHNIFLNFWLELGLLGLVSFALILFFTLQRHQKQPKTLTLAAGMFLLILILHGLVDVPYFKNDLSLLFWFVIALFYI